MVDGATTSRIDGKRPVSCLGGLYQTKTWTNIYIFFSKTNIFILTMYLEINEKNATKYLNTFTSEKVQT